MDYVYNTGLVEERTYSYTATTGSCTPSKLTKIAATSGPRLTKIAQTEAAHLQALRYSPISVVVDSSFLYYYGSGVILDDI